MQLEHLRYLVAVAQQGSMNKAAKKLFCAQPTLTSAIRTLESEIGVPLFERTSSGLVVTEVGKIVVSDAELMLSYVDRWKLAAQNSLDNMPINIQFTGVSPRYLTINSILRFQSKHPNIPINTWYKQRGDANNRIIVSYKTPAHLEEERAYCLDHGMEVSVLQEDEFLLYASASNDLINRDHIVSADLKGRLIYLQQNPFNFPYVHELKSLGCDIGPQIWSEENLFTALTLAPHTLSFRPSGIANHNFYLDNDLIRMAHIDDLYLPVYLCVIYPNAKRITSSEREFIDTLLWDFRGPANNKTRKDGKK